MSKKAIENNNELEILKQKQFSAIIHSPEYRNILEKKSKEIVNYSRLAQNEATIESYFDCVLFHFFKEVFGRLGYEYHPLKEVTIETSRHITKGRADTAIGALIIEFKQPKTLNTIEKQNKAVSQISDYMLGLTLESELVGFVTDGTKGCFVTRDSSGIILEAFSELNASVMDRLIQSIVKLSKTALSSKSLVKDFCCSGHSSTGIKLANSLYSTLSTNMTDRTVMLFNEWKELFNLSHDDISKQQAIIDRKIALQNVFQVEFTKKDEEYKALFALQTAYVIIVKIVAYRIISLIRYNSSFIDFEAISNTPIESLRSQLASLEEGAIFRDYGMLNLLEGDFFSWYAFNEQWNSTIAESLNSVFKVLSKYSSRPVLNQSSESRDFFKELYQGMMPAEVRHSLGEYYTKQWLAHHVVKEAIELCGVSKWKGVDPCCGSGTFVTAMIGQVLYETKSLSKEEQLKEILNRVKGIDLNPVAVLSARVNYFINISHLLDNTNEIEIPIFLGDSSYVPKSVLCDGIKCYEYSINTLMDPIEIVVPCSMVEDSYAFSKAMTDIEPYIKAFNEEGAYNCISSLVPKKELTNEIQSQIHKLTSSLVELERKNWDGIWARIITNFLTTANLGKFDVIVGNPPWVDWKSLPSGYRDRIISLCISRNLFSGDRVTGGINLNICALITNVVAENWLGDDGIIGFLMPEPLIFQPSYEGFRNLLLSDGSRLYIKKLSNWNKAGHPFYPVTQKFLTFFISRREVEYSNGIEVDWYVKKTNKNIDNIENLSVLENFNISTQYAATCHSFRNMFTYIRNKALINDMKSVAGESSYIGREGIEFYPQEMIIFEQTEMPPTKECTSLRNIQVKKSKYNVPQTYRLLETKYLHPLIQGTDITPFHIEVSGYIVPFPYDKKVSDRLPIPMDKLEKDAPKLAKFYNQFKKLICSQTNYNERIIGRKGEFYALARVGAYSFARYYVAFRDNSKWGAAVVSDIETKWGGKVRPQFQNHAVTICEDSEGNFISLNEAHYICGILNTPIASEYIINSSDSRSFPIRPRIYIPKYDSTNNTHKAIVSLSKKAHKNYDNKVLIDKILAKLNELYLLIAIEAHNKTHIDN